MPSDHDTLLRQWQMLRMIPRYPTKIASSQLLEKLHNDGFDVSKRTVERDLQSLSQSFPIVSDEQEKPFGWSWQKDAKIFDVPGLSNAEALTFRLAEQHLRPLLPASSLKQLEPYFASAAQKLSALADDNPIHAWTGKVRVVQPWQTLIAPKLSEPTLHTVYEALLSDRQLQINYHRKHTSEAKTYLLHPLGLVQRGQILYLVGAKAESGEVRHLVMHRIKSADMLEERAKRPKGFNLDAYIASGAFGFGGGEQITLEAIFKNGAGDHLIETPLSADQTLTPMGVGSLKLKAGVLDTEQLRWWLLGFGDRVEVTKPQKLRAAMVEIAANMARTYGKPR